MQDPHGKYVKRLNLPSFSEKTDDLKGSIRDDFDNIQELLDDSAFLNLFAAFENIAFRLVGTTTGEIRRIVKKDVSVQYPYFRCRESFIKDQNDIQNIRSLFALLENKINEDLYKKLYSIREHRNYIAHGKRPDVGQACNFPIHYVYITLSEILNIIKETD